MNDRFDLEQQMLDCWKIVSDLKDMREVVEEGGEKSYSELEGRVACIEAIYEVKFIKLWNTFNDMVQTRQFVKREDNNGSSE